MNSEAYESALASYWEEKKSAYRCLLFGVLLAAVAVGIAVVVHYLKWDHGLYVLTFLFGFFGICLMAVGIGVLSEDPGPPQPPE